MQRTPWPSRKVLKLSNVKNASNKLQQKKWHFYLWWWPLSLRFRDLLLSPAQIVCVFFTAQRLGGHNGAHCRLRVPVALLRWRAECTVGPGVGYIVPDVRRLDIPHSFCRLWSEEFWMFLPHRAFTSLLLSSPTVSYLRYVLVQECDDSFNKWLSNAIAPPWSSVTVKTGSTELRLPKICFNRCQVWMEPVCFSLINRSHGLWTLKIWKDLKLKFTRARRSKDTEWCIMNY